QFYKMCVDNSTPFYYVYGGTQDNGSQRVASRTVNKIGIRTADSKKVGGGDGFQPRVDPLDPKIVYTTSQNGAMSRSDGKGGKGGGGGKSIRPAGGGGGGGKGGGGGGAAWNWDTPYIISPHSNTRLYAGSNLVYRSDNRGDSWKAISPNLTRSMKAMEIPIMGKVWGKDTPARNASTTPISVLNALEESPLVEGLIYAGTNDGILAVTEDTGKNWRKIDSFPGIPKLATISHICPSNHDKDTVYVSFIYYEYGDFKPYILKSTDRAQTWTSISSNLSARDFVWTIVEDPVKKGLLFAGTEFGLYFSVDDGKKWVQFKNGLPIISFRDMEIQKREGDLVCATFGRGFFILDDITALRQFTPQTSAKEGTLFTPRKTYVYEEKTNVQRPADNSEMPNPKFGALISYYLSKDLPSGQKIVLTVMDASGTKVREVEGTGKAGFNRVAWDLRPAGGETTLVKPGKYKVTLAKVGASNVTPLGEAQEFEVVPLPSSATGEEQAFIDPKLLTPAL
ncbi:MAG TPA: hypothetical protein VE988_22600, partial [Gemmataceae bacterium]|nr:hypothetical protein [Gemmataceae bacterium]